MDPSIQYVDPSAGDDDDGSNIGRWTQEEHMRFLEAYRLHGKDWRKLAQHVGTRSNVQCRTHAQKHFKKLFAIAQGHSSTTTSELKLSLAKPSVCKKRVRTAEDDSSATDEDPDKDPSISSSSSTPRGYMPPQERELFSKKPRVITDQPALVLQPQRGYGHVAIRTRNLHALSLETASLLSHPAHTIMQIQHMQQAAMPHSTTTLLSTINYPSASSPSTFSNFNPRSLSTLGYPLLTHHRQAPFLLAQAPIPGSGRFSGSTALASQSRVNVSDLTRSPYPSHLK